MSTSRRLLVISSDPEGPTFRFRWLAYAEALAASGIDIEVAPWPKALAVRRRTLARASEVDGVVVSSRLLTVRVVNRLRRRARRLAFDFDDALPFRDSRKGASPSPTRRRRFRALVRAADLVLAGNRYLQGLASDFGGEGHVVPTTVKTRDHPISPEPSDGPTVIGWIGSEATIPYLESRALVLSALSASGRPYRLLVIADVAPVFPTGIPVDFVPWKKGIWRDVLAGAHFGLAPLPDDPWAQGKCGLKLLQYLSLGRPVVASAVGVQKEQVQDGVTGFLAQDRESFLDGILELMDDPERRRKMGAAGYEDVRENWSVAAWAPKVVGHMQQLLD